MTTLERKARMRKRMSNHKSQKDTPEHFMMLRRCPVYMPEWVPMQLPLQQPLIRRRLEGIRQLV